MCKIRGFLGGGGVCRLIIIGKRLSNVLGVWQYTRVYLLGTEDGLPSPDALAPTPAADQTCHVSANISPINYKIITRG